MPTTNKATNSAVKYVIYFISDGTGITSEALGRSLLSQFEHLKFETITIPFIDTLAKAKKASEQINRYDDANTIAIIFDTIIDKKIRNIIKQTNAYMIDIFATFISPLEDVLKSKSSYSIGKSHSIVQHIVKQDAYKHRIEAINFSINNDDGIRTSSYNEADIILIGVSRCGKTPTCLYLALQFGINAANYPLVTEDLNIHSLPACLKQYKNKIFGLTIDSKELALIRSERRKNSGYASLTQCKFEVESLEQIYAYEKISYLNTTGSSIEEIATRILDITHITRKLI